MAQNIKRTDCQTRVNMNLTFNKASNPSVKSDQRVITKFRKKFYILSLAEALNLILLRQLSLQSRNTMFSA